MLNFGYVCYLFLLTAGFTHTAVYYLMRGGVTVINKVMRVFVEKNPGYDVEAMQLQKDIQTNLGIHHLKKVRILNCYDVEGLSESQFQSSVKNIFSEKTVDTAYNENFPLSEDEYAFAVEYLPGQYDQRADSAAECIQLFCEKRPLLKASKIVVLKGNLNTQEIDKIKKYYINPVDTREAVISKPDSIDLSYSVPTDVDYLDGFILKSESEIKEMHRDLNLAMSPADLQLCQSYFRDEEKRDPSITEIRVLDTYWSDHCRHTTFLTEITNVSIEEGKLSSPITETFNEYLKSREAVYGTSTRPVTLMDIALIAMKELKKNGILKGLDESDEINACSIKVPVAIDDRTEEWLVMFKNETHNHPTEIEPFGGAATCLGGAIRDPLSGRSYVYQAMRVTGSGDPRVKIEDTLPGKLPQRKITTGAAHGYSSYGNQIGLATGMVTEIYDKGYVAKRMEIGAVIGAAPSENVVRKAPAPGDIIILLGGRTGRDGCGGATGSSKKHTLDSLVNCGAEVQKGNPPTERKIQRLFRKKEVSCLIKRCNDFGAGGVSVAIGELADGLVIDLDKVPRKYEGLDGTELAISESQERMAVVVEAKDAEAFMRFSEEENLEATIVAEVTAEARLIMTWRNKVIVNISRDFLNTNGAKSYTDVKIKAPGNLQEFFDVKTDVTDIKEKWANTLIDLNVCSQKGLVERFDSTIGSGTVLMPFGGRYQLTPTEAMVCKLPVLKGETKAASIMSFGFNPDIAKISPFHGAVYAIVEAVSRAVAVGADYSNMKLTLQEYFERLGNNPDRWGKPFAALLGAYYAQKNLGIAAIGGKDSMSGSFNDLDVPPTLVAFAVDVIDNCDFIISPEFKSTESKVVLVTSRISSNYLPDFDSLKNTFDLVKNLIRHNSITACQSIKAGGICEAISKMCFGNKIGFKFSSQIDKLDVFAPRYGSFLIELPQDADLESLLEGHEYMELGYTQNEAFITLGSISLSLDEMINSWENPLENIFPSMTNEEVHEYADKPYEIETIRRCNINLKNGSPKIFIPVFSGTNCEYDSTRAFENAGGRVSTIVFKNLSPKHIEDSVRLMVKEIKDSQIIMLPGGFSAGDEPDGSGKFIANVFRNPLLSDAVMDLLKNRDGLMLGICNGFQALIKLGLVPYGEIREIDEDCPTLTYNNIGRHVSCLVDTKITSNLSPWFNSVRVGDIHTVPVSHGEGRFVGPNELIHKLFEKGQVATQYVDMKGTPVSYMPYNPNGSMFAIEGITSPDGRVLGKMAHSERIGSNLYKNIAGNMDQKLFEAGINYFK